MSDRSDYFEKAFASGLVDRLTTAFWVYDFDEKRVVWANKAALCVWQAETLEALRARDLGADMSPSVERRLGQYREDFIASDATFSELWTLYPGSVPVTLRVVYRGFRLEDGRMAMLCEGLETEADDPDTLRSADALLHTPVMISLFSQRGEQLYRNPAARIAYGGGVGSLAKQFADADEFRCFEDALADGGVARLAMQTKTIGGARWHEVTAYGCKDAVTGEDSILVSEIDISDSKAAEQRLVDFASISSDWFWEMDSELRFTYLSERTRDIFGTEAEGIIGKTREAFVLEMDDNWRAHFDDLKNKRPFRDFRYTRRETHGGFYHVSISGLPIFDRHGRFAGYRGTGTNVTEKVEAGRKIAKQKRLEAELAKEKEINGLQRQFVSMVSHEFRTPLAIIDGSAQRLLRRLDGLTPERAGQTLQKVRRSVARLTELMESVLNAARLEEGRIVCEPEPCDLKAIIGEICESYAEVYPDHAIEVDVTRLPEQVVADPKLIRQVVSNLTSNAVKYSAESTTITVSGTCDEGNGDILVAVRDEGVGIPKSELDQLCNRFFRASTSTGIAGTGIGLHLVQHFMAMHGGRIDVDSVEGEGSTFSIRFPARAA